MKGVVVSFIAVLIMCFAVPITMAQNHHHDEGENSHPFLENQVATQDVSAMVNELISESKEQLKEEISLLKQYTPEVSRITPGWPEYSKQRMTSETMVELLDVMYASECIVADDYEHLVVHTEPGL